MMVVQYSSECYEVVLLVAIGGSASVWKVRVNYVLEFLMLVCVISNTRS